MTVTMSCHLLLFWYSRVKTDQGSGVTESFFFSFFFWGGGDKWEGGRPSSGGLRGRHRNEGCTMKSQMGGSNGGPMV